MLYGVFRKYGNAILYNYPVSDAPIGLSFEAFLKALAGMS